MKWRDLAVPERTVIIYVIFAGLWIVLSDRLLLLITSDVELLDRLETIKGWVFVVASGLLLFLVLARYTRTRKRDELHLQRLATAIDQADEAIMITDADGTIRYVNPAFTMITGYAQDEAVGNTPRILNSGRQSRGFYEEMWQTIAGGATWHGQLLNRRKNGSLYTEEGSISPVVNEAGEIVNFVAVKRDITERLALEAQLVQAQKLESLGTLAAGVAHDFNNILAVILAYSSEGRDLPAAPDRALQRFEAIRNAAGRASKLVRQLLTFARRSAPELQTVDANAVVVDLEKVLRETFPETIETTIELSQELPPTKADSGQLHQVLLNLCINARDAMPSGGTLRISTRCDASEGFGARRPNIGAGRYVVIEVRDSGSGMDEATKRRVFEPFFTTKPEGKGTGLGLAIAYGIIKSHGGFIEVESAPGAGSAFRVCLPADREDLPC